MVKSPKKKLTKLFSYDHDPMITSGEMSSKSQFWKDGYCALHRKKMMGFDYCEEYLRSRSNKILLWQC